MNARNPVGICVAFGLALGLALPASGTVMVIGGGMARDCYEAVEYKRRSQADSVDLCSRALEEENLSRRNRAATLVNRGILFMRQSDNTRALADFDRSLEISPDLHEAKVNQGAALYGLKRYDEAMAALNIGVRSDDLNARATAHYNRALIHELRGDVRAAYEDFSAAVEIAPAFELAARQLSRFQIVPASGSSQPE